jgi:hypothetical protein
LPDRIEAKTAAPTLLVIGRVITCSETLAWFRPENATGSRTRSTG